MVAQIAEDREAVLAREGLEGLPWVRGGHEESTPRRVSSRESTCPGPSVYKTARRQISCAIFSTKEGAFFRGAAMGPVRDVRGPVRGSVPGPRPVRDVRFRSEGRRVSPVPIPKGAGSGREPVIGTRRRPSLAGCDPVAPAADRALP